MLIKEETNFGEIPVFNFSHEEMWLIISILWVCCVRVDDQD